MRINGNFFMWRHQQEHIEGKSLSACVNGIQISKSSAPLSTPICIFIEHMDSDSIGSHICTRMETLPALEELEKGIAAICMRSVTQRTWRDSRLSLPSSDPKGSFHRIHSDIWTQALRWPSAGQTDGALLPCSLTTGLTSWASHPV